MFLPLLSSRRLFAFAGTPTSRPTLGSPARVHQRALFEPWLHPFDVDRLGPCSRCSSSSGTSAPGTLVEEQRSPSLPLGVELPEPGVPDRTRVVVRRRTGSGIWPYRRAIGVIGGRASHQHRLHGLSHPVDARLRPDLLDRHVVPSTLPDRRPRARRRAAAVDRRRRLGAALIRHAVHVPVLPCPVRILRLRHLHGRRDPRGQQSGYTGQALAELQLARRVLAADRRGASPGVDHVLQRRNPHPPPDRRPRPPARRHPGRLGLRTRRRDPRRGEPGFVRRAFSLAELAEARVHAGRLRMRAPDPHMLAALDRAHESSTHPARRRARPMPPGCRLTSTSSTTAAGGVGGTTERARLDLAVAAAIPTPRVGAYASSSRPAPSRAGAPDLGRRGRRPRTTTCRRTCTTSRTSCSGPPA